MNNKKAKKKLVVALVVVGSVLAVGVGAGFIFQDRLNIAANDIKTSIENQGKPKFVFNATKFPDWATAGNVYTNPDDITGDFPGSKDDLPIAGINVSQCEQGSGCNELVKKCEPWRDDKPSCKELVRSTTNTHCFVSLFYNERKIDPEKEVAKYIEHNKSFDSMTTQEAGARTLTISTPEGDKTYRLHLYDYKSRGSDTIKRGNAIGYVALAHGHIDIRSVCSEVRQLDETLPVLEAIGLEV